MGRLLRWLVILICVGGVTGAIYAFVGRQAQPDSAMKLVAAELGSITEKALAVGQIEPRERFQVKSKISGIVARASGDFATRPTPLNAPPSTRMSLLLSLAAITVRSTGTINETAEARGLCARVFEHPLDHRNIFHVEFAPPERLVNAVDVALQNRVTPCLGPQHADGSEVGIPDLLGSPQCEPAEIGVAPAVIVGVFNL